jgi:hypothetical protein
MRTNWLIVGTVLTLLHPAGATRQRDEFVRKTR